MFEGLTIKANKARYCPALRCSICDHPITDTKMANVIFSPPEGEGEHANVTVVCKGCDPRTVSWMPLTHFLTALLSNVGYSEDDRKSAEEWLEIGV